MPRSARVPTATHDRPPDRLCADAARVRTGAGDRAHRLRRLCLVEPADRSVPGCPGRPGPGHLATRRRGAGRHGARRHAADRAVGRRRSGAVERSIRHDDGPVHRHLDLRRRHRRLFRTPTGDREPGFGDAACGGAATTGATVDRGRRNLSLRDHRSPAVERATADAAGLDGQAGPADDARRVRHRELRRRDQGVPDRGRCARLAQIPDHARSTQPGRGQRQRKCRRRLAQARRCVPGHPFGWPVHEPRRHPESGRGRAPGAGYHRR